MYTAIPSASVQLNPFSGHKTIYIKKAFPRLYRTFSLQTPLSPNNFFKSTLTMKRKFQAMDFFIPFWLPALLISICLIHPVTSEALLIKVLPVEHPTAENIFNVIPGTEYTPGRKSICPLGSFECKNDTTACIPQDRVCNKNLDCPDGSDEVGCRDKGADDFWDNFFQKRPGAKVDEDARPCKFNGGESDAKRARQTEENFLNDSRKKTGGRSYIQGRDMDEKIIQLPARHGSPQFAALAKPFNHPDFHKEKEHLQHWEAVCKCVSDELFCENSMSIDLNTLPRDVTALDLTGSHFSFLELTKSSFPKLKLLVLTHSFIGKIAYDSFQNLGTLITLHLTSNNLETIPAGSFRSNHNLETLRLDHNQLAFLDKDAFKGLHKLKTLDLKHNQLEEILNSVFTNLEFLETLDLSFNRIKTLHSSMFSGLSHLKTLQLSFNDIETMEEGTFSDMASLKHLYLSSNRLQYLDDDMFCNLNSLETLILNRNEISQMTVRAFSCLPKLKSMNLENNRFGEIENPRLIFSNLTQLGHIYFDHFWMCWWVPHVRDCQPKGDGISSVENLLDNIILRSCVWLMGLIGVAGNLFVIVSRMLLREPNRVHSFYIKNLALADLLMGLYLLSIAVHDVHYRGEFLARQYSWRHSRTCQFSGVLSTVSSEASVLILTLITLDRYLSIVKPFAAERSRKSITPALTIIIFLWVLSFILSYLPLSGSFHGYFGSDFYSTNGLCLPLNIHNPFDPAWEYSFVLFVIINSLAFTFISYAYWKMLRIIQSSSLTIRSTQEKQDSILAKRFGLVVLTDFLCWAPVIIAKVLATCGVSIPSTMYAWLAVFVLPVNSALNPIIYTMTTKLFKQQMAKLTVGFRKKLRRPGQLDDSTASLSFLYRNRTQRTITSSFASSLRRSSTKYSTKRVITRNSAEPPLPVCQTALVSGIGQIHPIPVGLNNGGTSPVATVTLVATSDSIKSSGSPIQTVTTTLIPPTSENSC